MSDDIARAMSSISARISTQPGKTSLGIEIPNTKRDSVLFGDLIEEDEFEIENDSSYSCIGKRYIWKKYFCKFRTNASSTNSWNNWFWKISRVLTQ